MFLHTNTEMANGGGGKKKEVSGYSQPCKENYLHSGVLLIHQHRKEYEQNRITPFFLSLFLG